MAWVKGWVTEKAGSLGIIGSLILVAGLFVSLTAATLLVFQPIPVGATEVLAKVANSEVLDGATATENLGVSLRLGVFVAILGVLTVLAGMVYESMERGTVE